MPAVGETLAVDGLRELQRAFAAADKQLIRDLKDALKDAAEPVRSDAEHLAVSEIRRMRRSLEWSEMRIGVHPTNVYVAPVKRGVKSRGNARHRRGNLAFLLLERSMVPALDRNEGQTVRRMDALLADIEHDWGRGG